MNLNRILNYAMEIGEEMLLSGAGVSRVEDTIERICKAYGADEINVFSITSSIVTSIKDETGTVITQTKRIHNYHTDFNKLDQLNNLSRYMCKELPEAEEIENRLMNIKNEKSIDLKSELFASAMIAGFFAVFFGGGLQEGIIAAFIGAFVKCFERYMQKFTVNVMLLNFISSFLVTLFAWTIAQIGFSQDFGKVIIGNIMLLVPGISFVNALRDMIGGDTMSGIMRICEAVLLTIFLAGGSFTALVMLGGI